MKVNLVVPGWSPKNIWGQIKFKFPPLSLTTLASFTPADVEVVVTDENVEEIKFDDGPDLVGITTMTPQANRAYQIADEFRRRGAKVILGGFHPSTMPQEALSHADAIVVGEGEAPWRNLIEDARCRRLKQVYRERLPLDLSQLKPPRRDVVRGKGYLFTNTIQVTRGCPLRCEFCSVTSLFGRSYRTKPIQAVIDELVDLKRESVFLFIVDDNLIGKRDYAERLLRAMEPLRFKWAGHAPLHLVEDDSLMRLVSKSGCFALFVGFESLSRENFSLMGKPGIMKISPRDAVKKFHDHGIGVLASFILGYDYDTNDSFKRILDLCNETRIDGAIFPILTPYPGTPLRKRLQKEGRILTDNWDMYDMEHVTFRPKGMTVDELERGYEWLNTNFLSWDSILKRIFKFHRSIQIFGPMNVGFRSAWRKRQ
ncbi:MAG: B12-binding domain-containing radical SAM protein [Syntrophobacterales bacterium]|nr:MAG: B12-binding domain-containing radical SAM protein [Syntrophobacterales bacterium]